MKKSFEAASELDGYEVLRPEDQERLDKAWEDGAVADEDVPETARKPEKDGEDEDAAEKPKKKKAPAKKTKVSFCVYFFTAQERFHHKPRRTMTPKTTMMINQKQRKLLLGNVPPRYIHKHNTYAP